VKKKRKKKKTLFYQALDGGVDCTEIIPNDRRSPSPGKWTSSLSEGKLKEVGKYRTDSSSEGKSMEDIILKTKRISSTDVMKSVSSLSVSPSPFKSSSPHLITSLNKIKKGKSEKMVSKKNRSEIKKEDKEYSKKQERKKSESKGDNNGRSVSPRRTALKSNK
jgi:hypothetical protein